MIRIDEIYDQIFWPYINKNIPNTRLFYCYPFGHTAPENLNNIGSDETQSSFIYCHDQEPVYPDTHRPLFDSLHLRNRDLNNGYGPDHAVVITSEKHSDSLTQVCSKYNWQPYYYFFHGWAALDWYRGYDRNYAIVPAVERRPQKIYFAPNRIISGHRSHRLLLMYHLLRKGCDRGYYSLPIVCPDSGDRLENLVAPFANQYPDMQSTFDGIKLPANLPGEIDHPMHSCWLSQFDACADSLVYVVTETVAHGQRLHLTEKIFRPICMQMPFIIASTRGSLAYLRSYGFQTFSDFWSEDYDNEPDDCIRIQKVADVVANLHALSDRSRQDLWHAMQPVIEHNHLHFYRGGFENILWGELSHMLTTLKSDLAN